MHVSSLGEFEQGRPVLEMWKSRFPGDRILLSFYSPSGFNIRKNYPLADLVFYLPLDTRGNMKQLVRQFRPDLFILVKYDFWPNLLNVLQDESIPTYLISARFRPDQYFFKWWGRVFLTQLKNFRLIFVQDEASSVLLHQFQMDHVVVAGDTRVDAVMKSDLRRNGRAAVEEGFKVIIGGSTWPAEEKMLAQLWQSSEFKAYGAGWRLVIAPHDISEEHLKKIEILFGNTIIRYSCCPQPWQDAFNIYNVILVDSIGLLSSLYAYADVAIIGGGFGKGIHNTLEPAAFGLPVVFGPRWAKFREAERLIDLGAAFPVSDYESFSKVIKMVCSDPEFRSESGRLALSYMRSQMGSSDLIIRHLLEKY
jgi:3-deoxy-D-manno-octulosonic-acid transferase